MSLFLSLLLASAVAGQDLNRLVTAEVRAASAPIAIAELSKQVGYPLEAMVSTKDDILIIKVKNVPLRALLDKIASSTNTGWEQTSTGLRLIRTDEMRRKELIEEQAALALQIQSAFDRMKKRLTEDGELTERGAQLTATRLITMNENQQNGQPMTNWQEQQRLQSMAPAYRLLRKISPQLDAKTLSTIPANRNVVFANFPNRVQRPMPTNIQPLLQAFVKEQTIWAKALKTARERRGGQERFYYENIQDPSQRKIGKVLLVLNRSAQNRSFQVRLTIADEKGRSIGSAQESIGWDWESYNKQLQEVQKNSANEESIVFTGTSKKIQDSIQAIYKSARQNNGQPDVQGVSPDIQEILINPDKYEPLSFVATDAIFETSRIKGLNVVCSATDMMMFGSAQLVQGAAKPAAFLASLNGLSMESDIKAGWLVMKPQVASSSRYQRSDRHVLGQYLRQVVKDGRVSLDNRANYAFRNGKEEEDFMPMFVLSMIGILRQGMEYGGDWDTLRLFGSLTAPQRQAAKTGQPIPFRALQPAQLDIMRHLVFDSQYPRLQISYQQEDFADMQSDEGIIYGGGLDSEPTEVLPNGFTGTEMLTITETNAPKFFGKPESEDPGQMTYWGEGAYDANGLAHEIFQSERPEFFPWRNQPGYPRGKLNKVRMGNQRQFMFLAQFTRRASLNLQLTDKDYKGEAMEISKLPPDVKKQIEDALARLREQYKDAKPPVWNPGNGGGAIPPPPPS